MQSEFSEYVCVCMCVEGLENTEHVHVIHIMDKHKAHLINLIRLEDEQRALMQALLPRGVGG